MSDERRFCPLLGKKCIGEKCAAWLGDQYEQKGETKYKHDCTVFFWNTLYLRAIAFRTDAAQGLLEGLRNNEQQGVALITAAIQAAGQRRIEGNGMG